MSPYTLEQSMQAAFRDGSMIMLGAPYKKSSFALVAAENISSVGALKGKRIAVSQLADAPYNYAVGLLAKAKLTPRDVEWIAVGTGAGGRAAAVVAGRADATMHAEATKRFYDDKKFAGRLSEVGFHSDSA